MSGWRLFGLDVADDAQWTIQWSPPWPAWFTVIVVAPLLLAFVAFCYRRHQTPGSRGRRLVLAALRLAVLCAVLAVLFDPVLSVETQVTRRSTVAILVDESLSMTFQDHHPAGRDGAAYDAEKDDEARLVRAAGWVGADGTVRDEHRARLRTTPRWKLLLEVWRAHAPAFLQRLERQHAVKVYAFATRLRRNPDLNPATASDPTGAHTKLGDAIREVLDDLKGQPVAAVIVLTDGRHNAGETTPLEAARSASTRHQGVPVYPVGVGAVTVPADMRIEQVRAPEVVLADEQVQIEFTCAHTGFAGFDTRAELRRGDEHGPVLADTQFKLIEAPNTPQRQILKVRPFDTPGEYELTLLLERDPADTVRENNEKRLRLRVVDGRYKVLYVDGRPRFEYRHLSLALSRDQRIAANVLLAESDDGVEQRHSAGVAPLAEFPRHATERDGARGLFDFDVLILGDVAFDAKRGIGIFAEPTAQMELVQRFVDEAGGGVVFLAGPDANPWRFRGTPLEPLLPVELLDEPGRESALDSDGFQPRIAPAGKGHVLLQLHPDTANDRANEDLWAKGLQSLLWSAPVRGPKLHASVLLEHPHQARPLLATMWYGRGRTVWVGTDEVWRWRHLQGDRYYYRFFSNLIRFVGNNRLLGDERRFEITLEKTAFTLGEGVVVRARVWDEGFQRLSAPEVTVQLEVGDGPAQPLVLEAPDPQQRPGEFEGRFIATRLGPHRLWFDLQRGVERGKAAVTSFDVTVPQREMENPALDAGLLQALWDESRATYAAKEAGADRRTFFRLWELPAVAAAVPAREVILTGVDATYRLWDTWLVFAILVGLLCVEWLGRKLTRLP